MSVLECQSWKGWRGLTCQIHDIPGHKRLHTTTKSHPEHGRFFTISRKARMSGLIRKVASKLKTFGKRVGQIQIDCVSQALFRFPLRSFRLSFRRSVLLMPSLSTQASGRWWESWISSCRDRTQNRQKVSLPRYSVLTLLQCATMSAFSRPWIPGPAVPRRAADM